MNNSRKPTTIQECKIQASILLNSLRSTNAELSLQAAKRFLQLPEYSSLKPNQVHLPQIKRKHALAVIATENGFSSWNNLKMELNFFVGGFLNHWFTTYDAAKACQKDIGGFLLPYKKQFFICEAAYIKHIDFDHEDLDWKLIDYDWVKPKDISAWQRLYRK